MAIFPILIITIFKISCNYMVLYGLESGTENFSRKLKNLIKNVEKNPEIPGIIGPKIQEFLTNPEDFHPCL